MQRVMPESATRVHLPPPQLTMGATEWALIVLHSTMWGSAFFFGAIAIKEISPLTITAFRLIPACLIVAVACMFAGNRIPAKWHFWQRMLVLGFVNNMAPMLLILWAQHQVAGGVAAVFNATAPLFAVILAHFATADEKMSWRKIAGILAGVAGVSVLVGTDVTSGTTGDVLAKIALLGAACLYAISGVFARSSSHEPPFVIAFGQMFSAMLLAMPLALIVDRPWMTAMPSQTAVAAVLAMGVFGSAFAALLYFTVLRRAGATNTLLVTLLLPLTPIILGTLFLGETFGPREMAGAALIGIALVILDGRLPRALATMTSTAGR
jgi:drug/metabolite transporter (DMT)-like permease